ncbi:MAG: peroxiredoxin, partial [Deltaproteobacteria bacterium]
MVQEGEKAPDFSAETAEGTRLTLGDFVGKRPLILYFYPKDNTTGCTKEACAFRDMSGEIEAAGGAVVGVSNDSRDSHERFKAQHRLNFPLLTDPEGTLAKAYGVAR